MRPKGIRTYWSENENRALVEIARPLIDRGHSVGNVVAAVSAEMIARGMRSRTRGAIYKQIYRLASADFLPAAACNRRPAGNDIAAANQLASVTASISKIPRVSATQIAAFYAVNRYQDDPRACLPEREWRGSRPAANTCWGISSLYASCGMSASRGGRRGAP